MMKASDIGGFLSGLVIVAVIGLAVWWRVTPHGRSLPPAHPQSPPPSPVRSHEDCGAQAGRAAAQYNAQSLETLAWAPFGRPETGWTTYAPLVAREVATRCEPASPGFAVALARWQAGRQRPPTGVFDADDFKLMLTAVELRRPFVQATSRHICPAPPEETSLASADSREGYGQKVVRLRPAALEAYRRLAVAAKAAGMVRDADDFKLISGFRGPVEEAAGCVGGRCNTVTRASCSAHRTGMAVDLYLGHAAGADPTSTADDNRRAISRTLAYRWLVSNADRFGFVPYPYEPWHWEWTGEAP